MKLSRADRKWQTFNLKLQKQMQENNFWGLGTTYYEMATFLEKDDKEFEHLRQKGYEMKREFQKQSAKQYLEGGYIAKLEVYANNDSCQECKKLSGTVVLLQEVIDNPPIPIRRCTFKPYGCRCTFLPVVG